MAKIGKKLNEIIDQVVDNILDSPEVDKAIDEVVDNVINEEAEVQTTFSVASLETLVEEGVVENVCD